MKNCIAKVPASNPYFLTCSKRTYNLQSLDWTCGRCSPDSISLLISNCPHATSLLLVLISCALPGLSRCSFCSVSIHWVGNIECPSSNSFPKISFSSAIPALKTIHFFHSLARDVSSFFWTSGGSLWCTRFLPCNCFRLFLLFSFTMATLCQKWVWTFVLSFRSASFSVYFDSFSRHRTVILLKQDVWQSLSLSIILQLIWDDVSIEN